MKSIAVVSGSRKFDGIYQLTLSLAETLTEIGHPIKMYQAMDPGHGFIYGSFPNQETMNGIYLPSKTLEMGLNRMFVYPRRISKLVEDEILICDPSMIGAMKDLSRATIYVPDIRPLTEYGDNYLTTMMFKHVVPKLRGAKRLIVTSNALKQKLIERGVDEERIKLVYPTSSLGEDYSKAFAHISSSLNMIKQSNTIRCLYIATDRPYKNIGFYVELAKKFSSSTEQAKFEFCLLSKLKSRTLAHFEKLKLPNFRVVDHIADVNVIYDATDILVFPSLYEGFGLPLLEAMSVGLPVLASNVSPMNEIVSGWGNLCEPNNLEDWLDKMQKFHNPVFYEEQARLSLDRSAFFSKENMKRALSIAFEER